MRTKDPNEARRRHAERAATLQVQWDLLRKGPATLDDKQVEAIAGLVYRAFLAAAPRGARNPIVHHSFAGVRWILEMAIGDSPVPPGGQVDRSALEGVLALQVAAVSTGRCLIDERTRQRVLARAAVAIIQASKQVVKECERLQAQPGRRSFPG